MNAEVYTKIGFIKYKLKDYYGVIVALNYALEINSSNPTLELAQKARAYFIRGVAKYEFKDRRGACEDGRKAKQFGYPIDGVNALINETCY